MDHGITDQLKAKPDVYIAEFKGPPNSFGVYLEQRFKIP